MKLSFRKRVKTKAALALMTAGLSALPMVANAPQASATACSSIIVIGVRGTNEPAGYGATVGPMVSRLMSKFNPYLVYATPLNYPASLNYGQSEPQGVRNLTSYINNIRTYCPATQFILVGHSQGADVVGDAVQANSFGGKVIGVAMTGDPNFRGGSKGNYVVDKTTGMFVSPNPTLNGSLGTRSAWPTRLDGKVHNLCLLDDTVCRSSNGALGAAGAIGDTPHNSYMKRKVLSSPTAPAYLADKMYTLANGYGGHS